MDGNDDLQHTGEKSLRIGTNLIVARSIFGELWNAYHLVCPDVQTKVSLEENEALLLKLQNFELDSVIIDRECNIPELVCREIADDEYFLICGTKSHFFNCKEARLADLKDENFFMLARGNPTRDYFEQSFHDHHLEPRTIDFNNIDIFCAAEVNKKGAASLFETQLLFSIQNFRNRSFISSSVSSPRSACSSTCIAFATAAFHSSALIFPRTFLCFSRL